MKSTEYFNNGYSCSESIIMELADKGVVSRELLSLATPFSGGIGSGCLCGAIAGAQLVIGYLFGRENNQGNDNIARALAKEFMDEFKKKHRVTCCRILTSGLDMASPERKAHCTNMVEDCSKILNHIIEQNSKTVL